MPRNNTNKSRPHNEKPVVARATNRSTTSRKASNGKQTPSKRSRASGTSARSSTWARALREDPEIAALVWQAIDSYRAGRSKNAAQIMEEVVSRYPDDPSLWWYLGAIYLHELKDPAEALRCHQRATELSPTSERASLGLFHALWELNRIDEALAEIGRYQKLTNWRCQDYVDIVAELHDEWVKALKTVKKLKRKR